MLATFLLLAAPAGAGETLHFDPWLDLPVLAATGGYTAATQFLIEPPYVPQAAPAEPRLSLDARYAGLPEIDGEGPALLSDIVGFYPSFAAPFLLGGLGLIGPAGERGRLARAGTWTAIGIEAVTVNATLTDLVKRAVRRPRPYAYAGDWQAATAEALATGEPVDVEAQLSFPSGHASTAGAWSFCLAHVLAVTRDGPWYAKLPPYLGAAGITVWTGALRVRAHKHFPTDVLVGGLLGASVGVVVPELHRDSRLRLGAGTGPAGEPALALSGAW